MMFTGRLATTIFSTKINGRYITRNNLRKTRVFALQVFEADSNTRNPKSCEENRSRAHVALKVVVASRLV